MWSFRAASYLNNRLRLFITNVLNHVKIWSFCIALGTGDFASPLEELCTLTSALRQVHSTEFAPSIKSVQEYQPTKKDSESAGLKAICFPLDLVRINTVSFLWLLCVFECIPKVLFLSVVF